jgi:arabinose-5-phosphate isomerase
MQENWSGADVIRREADALTQLAAYLDQNFDTAVSLIAQHSGRVIVTGIGKSGLVGRKISATLASTGTPSLYLHPAEASHGDLGMLSVGDLVLMISKSGESAELADIIEYCRRHSIRIIAVTGEENSTVGRAAHIVLRLPKTAEACPMNLVPTASTTMTLALGDALAICCLQNRRFHSGHFRDLHPGGKLGQRLLRVRDLMHSGDAVPLIGETETVSAAILEMTRGCFGCVGVTAENGALTGIFTDGDLRRNFAAANLERPIVMLMTRSPQRVAPDEFIADVAHLFSSRRIPSVFVIEHDIPVGIIHIHDLMRKGLI